MLITKNIDEKKLVTELLENLPECSLCFTVTHWNYKECKFTLVDDDGTVYKLDYDMAKAGLELLINKLNKGELKGIAYVLEDIEDAGNWDAPAIDALLQCAVLKDVIYG
jgi:hypothetical protein